MKFPIYDISEETWKKYKEHDIIFENPYCPCTKPRNKQKYLNKMKQSQYVDCEGDVYRVTDYKLCEKNGIWKYIPFIANIEWQFEKTGETYPFEKLKQLMRLKIQQGMPLRLQNY